MGGAARVLAVAAESLDDDPQWAAELARTVVDAFPDHADGRALLTRALHALADRDPNPLRRNWYRCAALDASGQLRLSDVRDAVQRMFPLTARVLLETLRFRVAPEKAGSRTVSRRTTSSRASTSRTSKFGGPGPSRLPTTPRISTAPP
ncbi:alkyl sulfatase dimerization domain-containing protein [Thermobifida cellulosilytica]|uniref:Alkyl sulfatase dimerisation domain-containing protein n=1 Tax=Thermobifida cellulosilytica TB100 TaxID=665004 RepID=A0A147KK52_THECS|nr:alkyl sulfatase dimerization domain-containing protein [Thermobifida cellulosilytica]KUP97613.1 hypothetical protein AC529_06040 [Thermobifida cellulosilytica TB100]